MAKLYNWENRICPFVFKGPVSDIQYECLLKFCSTYNIVTHGFHFNSDTDVYGIRYYKEQWYIVMEDILFYDNATVVDPFTFIIRCLNGPEKQWFEDLNVGDTITIDNLSQNPDGYPFGVTCEMQDLIGKSFKITDIIPSLARIVRRDFFNGDFRGYILEDMDRTWHSSMFVPLYTTENLIKLSLKNIDLEI